jgi:SAM-dependent methyltransferase
MSWYKSWFNEPYYHILYQHRDEKEAEHFLDNLIHYLQPPPGASILDLACGRGRHSVYLNQKGFTVTGIDLSEENIRHCTTFENDTLSFFVHDMRHMFRVNDFDYVLNLFTSFGYFENDKENEAALKSACLALKPKGRLVIDFLNMTFAKRNLITSETITAGNINFNISRKIDERFLIKEIDFMDKGQDFHFIERVRTLQADDFKKFLENCGMNILATAGNYELQPFDSFSSPRLIIVAQKE